jgi:hypothetical protein
MHGRMKTCCHKTFTRMKKESKKCSKKRRKQKKTGLEFVGNAPMLVQIVMGKTIKTIQVYHNFKKKFNYKIFHALCS